MRPAAQVALLAALGAVALLARHPAVVGAIALVLFGVVVVRAGRRSRAYLAAIALSALAVLVISPLAQSRGTHPLWTGPIVPVLGAIDVTREELSLAAVLALRLCAVSLAFAVYALVLDHDRLVGTVGWARRSVLAVALATRLLPTLERDAAGFAEALRGRGVEVRGLRGRARLLSPVLAGELERALNLAEAMEARGYGRPGRTRPAQTGWGPLDLAALAGAAALVALGAAWL